jgi:predicted phosphoribosyltransferase
VGSPSAPFADRHDAGRQLGLLLSPLSRDAPLVVGLPRGGLPVAGEVAAALSAPLDFLAVRKLGAPHNPEYGFGAIAEDHVSVFDREALVALGIDRGSLEAILAREGAELQRRVAAYGEGRRRPPWEGRTVIVVDDGVATGLTDTAALRAARRHRPRRLLLAVPVCAPDSRVRLEAEADEVVCLLEPERFYGVGQWYLDFNQVTDAEVRVALAHADQRVQGKAAEFRRLPADGPTTREP